MNISHDFPLPKKADIRCTCGHVTRAVCESPITCHKCHGHKVLWVNPPPVKIKMNVGVRWMIATGLK